MTRLNSSGVISEIGEKTEAVALFTQTIARSRWIQLPRTSTSANRVRPVAHCAGAANGDPPWLARTCRELSEREFIAEKPPIPSLAKSVTWLGLGALVLIATGLFRTHESSREDCINLFENPMGPHTRFAEFQTMLLISRRKCRKNHDGWWKNSSRGNCRNASSESKS